MKLVKKDFALFCSECEKWIDRLGLQGYEVSYQFGDIEDCRATTSIQYGGRVATIALSDNGNDFGFSKNMANKQEELKSSAIHEVLELFLYRLRVMAFDRSIDADEWNAETHQIIHTLERIL